jgi:hypothetical protein
MTTDSKLESYLSALDKSLGPINVSDRAEIVTEIKSHVLEAQQRDSSQSLDSILSSLGEPEQVASKYLMDRGLKPAKPSKRPIVKWLVVGFLGTFALILGFITMLIFKFSPLIKVDNMEERVVLLGGLVDVNGKTGSVSIGDTQLAQHGARFSGSKLIQSSDVDQIFIPFTNAKFSLTNSADKTFSWECKAATHDSETNFITQDKRVLVLDLGKTSATKCEFKIPARTFVKIVGNNAKMEVEKPQYNLDFTAQNGKVELIPDTEQKYHFDIKAVVGKVDHFESSAEKDALQISISLSNGVVSKD